MTLWYVATVLIVILSGTILPSRVEVAAKDSVYSKVRFLQRFYGDEDQGQCAYAYGVIEARFAQWMTPVYVNTDNRPGGCRQSFAIVDPENALSGLVVLVSLSNFGTVRQCDETGDLRIPVSKSAHEIRWSTPYRIDTDDGPTGCILRFTVAGRRDIVLDVEFVADGEPDQCQNAGRHIVTTTRPLELRIKTDQRPGGCYLRFRLRKA